VRDVKFLYSIRFRLVALGDGPGDGSAVSAGSVAWVILGYVDTSWDAIPFTWGVQTHFSLKYKLYGVVRQLRYDCIVSFCMCFTVGLRGAYYCMCFTVGSRGAQMRVVLRFFLFNWGNVEGHNRPILHGILFVTNYS